jgi:hypothetical protein
LRESIAVYWKATHRSSCSGEVRSWPPRRKGPRGWPAGLLSEVNLPRSGARCSIFAAYAIKRRQRSPSRRPSSEALRDIRARKNRPSLEHRKILSIALVAAAALGSAALAPTSVSAWGRGGGFGGFHGGFHEGWGHRGFGYGSGFRQG